MRAFVCRRCRELAGFEACTCRVCGVALGFNPSSGNIEALQALGADGQRLALLDGDAAPRWARCGRAHLSACNWLVPWPEHGRPCLSCRLTTNLPPLKDREYRDAFAKAEAAKRRLIYQLLQLRLPIVSKEEDPGSGLSFELLAGDRHIVTGHTNGVITIDLNETDDAFREQTRVEFGEPYRTMLGHFRHEIGHYYWATLVAQPTGTAAEVALLDRARSVFGDERADYDAARKANYERGREPDWGQHYVSGYAAMHPLEDWAETFAHYLHIWDAVQTAASFGVLVVGRLTTAPAGATRPRPAPPAKKQPKWRASTR